MSRHAVPRPLRLQSVAAAVVVAFTFTLHPSLVSVAAHQTGGGADQNHFAMFPGKATWGPSPMAGGSLAAGTGSPFRRVLPLVRSRDAKVVATSVGVHEVKVSFPSSATAPRQPPRRPSRPAPAGYTVGVSTSHVGPLVMLRGGIRGDSPFVLTRRQTNTASRGLNANSYKRFQ